VCENVTLDDGRCEWQLDRENDLQRRGQRSVHPLTGDVCIGTGCGWLWGTDRQDQILRVGMFGFLFSGFTQRNRYQKDLGLTSAGLITESDPPMKAKTGSNVLVSLTTQRKTRPAQHKCDLCPSDFTTKHNLRSNISLAYHRRFGSQPRSDHMKSHYAIRDYRCEGSP
jgi:hypothetical protein